VPASTGEALSAGIMFVGEAFDDKTVLGVADAFAGCVNVVSF